MTKRQAESIVADIMDLLQQQCTPSEAMAIVMMLPAVVVSCTANVHCNEYPAPSPRTN